MVANSPFANLSHEENNTIQMYTTARQFRDAITPDEFLTVRNGKIRNRSIPFVVNRSFSCELYLKMILRIQGKEYRKNHSIVELMQTAELYDVFIAYVMSSICETGEKTTKEDLIDYLDSISKAFVNVRYVYEHSSLQVFYGILNILNDYLDDFCREIILKKHGIDMRDYTNI